MDTPLTFDTVDATTPTSRAHSLHSRLSRILDRRWAEWEPFVILRLKGIGSGVPLIRERHERTLSALLSQGIEMRTIRRLSLDDPRLSDSELDAKRERYLERRSRRKVHPARDVSRERERVGDDR